MEIYRDAYDTHTSVLSTVSAQDEDSSRSYNGSINLYHETNACPKTKSIRIKAVYKDNTMRFRLPLDFGVVKLKEEISERVKLELDSFDMKGLDDDHEWVWITCDEDVQEFVDISAQSGDNILRLLITDRFRCQTFDGTDEDQLRKEPLKRKAERIESSLICSYGDLKQHFGQKLNDVAANLGVSRSTIKRYCRKYGISRWPSHKRNKVAHFNTNENRNNRDLSQSENVCNVDQVSKQDEDKNVTIKATCDGHPMLKFPLRHKSKVVELEENVTSRLKLEVGSLTMMYEDEDLDWILIACDADLHYAIDTLTLLGRTTIKIKCHGAKPMQ